MNDIWKLIGFVSGEAAKRCRKEAKYFNLCLSGAVHNAGIALNHIEQYWNV